MTKHTLSVAQRRKLLYTFRKQCGITQANIGKHCNLSQAMLCQFENGNENLSAEAWISVLTWMSKIITRRLAEIEKTKKMVAKLGARGMT